VTVVRKIRVPLEPAQALEWIEQMEAFPCLPIDSGFVKIAAETSERFHLSYWDGAIVAAAQLMERSLIHGRSERRATLRTVRVRNPFVQPDGLLL